MKVYFLIKYDHFQSLWYIFSCFQLMLPIKCHPDFSSLIFIVQCKLHFNTLHASESGLLKADLQRLLQQCVCSHTESNL